MALSRNQWLQLIDIGEITISPYVDSQLKSNYYELHNDSKVSYYEDKYGRNNVIDSEALPELHSEPITKYGFILEPNRLYIIPMKETIAAPNYSVTLSPAPELAAAGLTMNMKGEVVYASDTFNISITSLHPLKIYPEQLMAQAFINEGNEGQNSVPIGGIIAFHGDQVPFGYTICDGSNGSPDLTDRFIRGRGSLGGRAGEILYMGGLSQIKYYELAYIMRYK